MAAAGTPRFAAANLVTLSVTVAMDAIRALFDIRIQ